jgi:hypothetical protein
VKRLTMLQVLHAALHNLCKKEWQRKWTLC